MNIEDIKVETIDDLIGCVRTTGTRLIIPLNWSNYIVDRLEIVAQCCDASDKVVLYIDRYNSHPEHRTKYHSASVYLSVHEAKQVVIALNRAIKEIEDVVD